MSDLDLAPIIEAAELAVYTKHHADECMCDLWPQDCRTWPGGVKAVLFSVNAEDVITAAAPLIERAVRNQAAQELLDWAHSLDDENPSLRTKRRHIRACAQRVAPEPTEDEMREALAGLLSGMAGRVCHLDEAGRSIPPNDDQARPVSGAKAADQ